MKKRVVTAFLCMALAAGLTACGTGKGENTASSPSADTSSDAAAASQDEGTEESHINMALFTYIEGLDPAEGWGGWNLTRCGVGETLITVI